MSLVASSIPGRLRLRHIALRNATRLEQLKKTIADWPYVQSVTVNARTGSVLVHYDEQAWGEGTDDCVRRIELAALQLLPQSPQMSQAPAVRVAPRGGTGGGTRRVRANRMAKRGMLVSLAISMLLAAAGNKRWHALSGVMFLHALAVHLWVHRHHVLK